MRRVYYIFAVFLLSFSSLVSAAGKPGFFDGDPDSNDFGEALLVSPALDLDGQRDLLRMIAERVFFLESNQLSLEDFEASIEAHRKERRIAQAYSNWCWAAGCALLGSAGAMMGMEWLLLAAGKSYQTMSTSPQGLWAFMGLLGGSLGGALGYGFSQARHATSALGSQRQYYSFRMEEILKVAEEVSLRMRASAVPLAFWSERREKFFQARFPAFQALEGMILKDEQLMHSSIQEALNELGSLTAQKREELTELTETEVHWTRVLYQKRLRKLELDTLYQVLWQLQDPEMPRVSRRLKASECSHILKDLQRRHKFFDQGLGG